MSLFDEIAGVKPASDKSSHYEREEVRAEIESLCRARTGSIPCDPGYGARTVDILGDSFRDGMDAWSDELEASLGRYEPRLRNPRVVPDLGQRPDLVVRVKIHGWLVVGKDLVPTQFTSTLGLNGFWSVR